MLTDRPDVPRTPFGRLKPPNGVFWGDTRTRLQFKRKFIRVLCNTLIHKKLIIFAIRGQLQLLEVNSRTFRTFQPKNVFLRLISDIVLLVALKMVTIVVIIARHVPWVNLLCFGVRKLH